VEIISGKEGISFPVTGQIIQLTMLGMAGPGRRPSSPTHFKDALLARTKEARLAADLSQEEISARLSAAVGREIRPDTYRKWELPVSKGGALLPHDLIVPFCDITGTDPYELLTGVPFKLGRRIRAVS
jgi:hypothetical protein